MKKFQNKKDAKTGKKSFLSPPLLLYSKNNKGTKLKNIKKEHPLAGQDKDNNKEVKIE